MSHPPTHLPPLFLFPFSSCVCYSHLLPLPSSLIGFLCRTPPLAPFPFSWCDVPLVPFLSRPLPSGFLSHTYLHSPCAWWLFLLCPPRRAPLMVVPVTVTPSYPSSCVAVCSSHPSPSLPLSVSCCLLSNLSPFFPSTPHVSCLSPLLPSPPHVVSSLPHLLLPLPSLPLPLVRPALFPLPLPSP